MAVDDEALVTKILREDDALVLIWDDGAQGEFPHSWLKANAPENRKWCAGLQPSPQTAPNPWSVCVEYDETLVISWAGLREVNRFPLSELKDSLPLIESAELALAAD